MKQLWVLLLPWDWSRSPTTICQYPVILLWEVRWPKVSTLDSGTSGSGLSPYQGHCVVFLGKTLYAHSASIHPGVCMGTSDLLWQPDMLGSNLWWTSIPSRGSSNTPTKPLHLPKRELSAESYEPVGLKRLYVFSYNAGWREVSCTRKANSVISQEHY